MSVPGTVSVFETGSGYDFSSALQDILPGIPVWRMKKVMSYRQEPDRFRCAKSFLMLEAMLRDRFGLEKCPEFSYGPFGKPYLAEYPDIHFNISHCRKGIACAVSYSPVGVDMEEILYDEAVASMTMNPSELTQIRESADPSVRFTELWTAKESYLKLTGRGLGDDIRDVLTAAAGVEFLTSVNRDEGYVITEARF